MASLDHMAETLPAQPPVTLHGDLHCGNLLATDQGLAPIDLDCVAQGPAVMELGSCIADCLNLALHDGHAPDDSAPHWRATLQAYGAAAGHAPPDEALLAWSTAQQLLCERALRCVVNLYPGRMKLVPALLQLATAIVRERSLAPAVRAGAA